MSMRKYIVIIVSHGICCTVAYAYQLSGSVSTTIAYNIMLKSIFFGSQSYVPIYQFLEVNL